MPYLIKNFDNWLNGRGIPIGFPYGWAVI